MLPVYMIGHTRDVPVVLPRQSITYIFIGIEVVEAADGADFLKWLQFGKEGIAPLVVCIGPRGVPLAPEILARYDKVFVLKAGKPKIRSPIRFRVSIAFSCYPKI